MPALHILTIMMHLCAHETLTTNLEVSDWCFHVILLDMILSFLTFRGIDKRFCFFHELCDWCHDKGKVIDETSTKLSHTIKDPNLLWVCKYWHIHYSLNLFRVWYFSFPRNYEP